MKKSRVWHRTCGTPSSEVGHWRQKNVWGPKLKWIKEDFTRSVALEVISEKYELYASAGEALQFLEAEGAVTEAREHQLPRIAQRAVSLKVENEDGKAQSSNLYED